MKVIELRFEINGTSYFVPTYENTSLQITKRVGSLEYLSSQSTITKETFRIPLEGDLINAIGDVSDLTTQANVNLNKRIKGSILIDGLPIFKGSFQFIKCYKDFTSGKKEVEWLFTGTETRLKQELEDVTMASLLAGETIPYNKAELDTFYASPETYKTTNGYYFPLVDYGQQFTGDNAATSGTIIGAGQTALTQLDFKPAVTFKKLFDNFPVDITWDSSINDLVEDQCVLLHNTDDSKCIVDTSPRDYTGYMDRSSDNTQSPTPATFTKVIFNREFNYNQDQIDLPNDAYSVPVTGKYTIRLKGDFYLTSTSSPTFNNYYTGFLVNASSSANKAISFQWYGVSNLGAISLSIDKTITMDLVAGETIELQCKQSPITTGATLDFTFKEDFRFEIIGTPAINANSNIDVPANCPELSGWDILRTILLQCNGIIETSSEGIYNIVPWNVWIESNTKTLNLDNKIDSTKDIEVNPYSIGGAKSITLGYEEGEDIYSKYYSNSQTLNYGDFNIKDTGTDGTNKKLEFKLPFASSAFSEIPSTWMPIVKLFDGDGNTVNNKPRLIQTYNGFVPISFDLKDAVTGVGTTRNIRTYPYTGHWEYSSGFIGGYQNRDYNFGQSLSFYASEDYPNNTLYNRFWKQYIEETFSEQSREVSLSVRIPIEIVDTLELNETVYFEGSRFRITELNNVSLNSDEPFTIKMMKRVTIYNIDVAPFYPYNVINGVVQWKDSNDNADLGDASGETASDVEHSALAYGFAYDANLNIANQRGQILAV